MEAEYYAHEYRRYATYVRNYKDMGKTDWWKTPQIIRIAGGANAENIEWTETLMRKIPVSLMGGLSVHFMGQAKNHTALFSLGRLVYHGCYALKGNGLNSISI